MLRRLLFSISAIFLSFGLFAQTSSSDSLIHLLTAKSMKLIEQDGVSYRKVVGPAKFLHNGTYLLCDTALWDVNKALIYAIGNVKIIQNNTELQSDKLTYSIEQNLAMFRGSMVQLSDNENNTLRTKYLDYNTKDSVAFFFNGGSMKDKDGQIIESNEGEYRSKLKTFIFNNKVEMFTDSVFINTDKLIYESNPNLVTFGTNTNAWKEDKMLSSQSGWYKRNSEDFFFTNHVHGLSNDREVWCDSLFFNRISNDIRMLGNVQMKDSTKNTIVLAGYVNYTDSSSTLIMKRNPALVDVLVDSLSRSDSVWFGASLFKYYSLPYYKIKNNVIASSTSRKEVMNSNAISTYRHKKAEEERKRIEEEQKQADEKAGKFIKSSVEESKNKKITHVADSTNQVNKNSGNNISSKNSASDSTDVSNSNKSTDSTNVVKLDSTKIGFLEGLGNVRVYKSNMQMLSDSLRFTDLDSLVRLYNKPIIWDNVVRQYTSDSLYLRSEQAQIKQASLMGNAFVVIQEDSICFDQIKSTDMMAYFDSMGNLSRFDALGDASALFYLKEDSTFATVNSSKSKMLSAVFKNDELDKIYYFEQNSNDAYPLAQMKAEDKTMKGFEWQPKLRPVSRYDISNEVIKKSQRTYYQSIPKTSFKLTDVYFPGYIQKVYSSIEHSEMARKRHREFVKRQKAIADSLELVKKDSIQRQHISDSLARLKTVQDSTIVKNNADSVVVKKDSLSVSSIDSLLSQPNLTPKELRKLEREKRRKLREENRRLREVEKKKKWARLDSLDSLHRIVLEEKNKAKIREKKRKALLKTQAELRKERELLNKYIEMYRKKKLKKNIN